MTLLADSSWISDIENVTFEDIAVPTQDLPDPEPENGNNAETLKQQEQRWNDLGLSQIVQEVDNGNTNGGQNNT